MIYVRDTDFLRALGHCDWSVLCLEVTGERLQSVTVEADRHQNVILGWSCEFPLGQAREWSERAKNLGACAPPALSQSSMWGLTTSRSFKLRGSGSSC